MGGRAAGTSDSVPWAGDTDSSSGSAEQGIECSSSSQRPRSIKRQRSLQNGRNRPCPATTALPQIGHGN